MHGAAHQQAARRASAEERTVERLWTEAVQPRPQPDVRGGGELRLQPGDPLEGGHDAEAHALQEQLPSERRAVQLALRQDALGHASTLVRMSVRVRMAPSPTGFLHIGNVRTALFNWLFARHEGGEFLLRIENTDTSREVAEATEQIQESLRWLGLDWDGEVTFQLDRHGATAARRRSGSSPRARRTRTRARSASACPTRASTAWDDVVRGRIEFPNEKLEDLVLVRSDGRPTYNFASPVEDWLRRDHARDPRRRPHLEHAEADPDPRGARRRRSPSTRTSRTSSARTARSSRSATARSPSRSSATQGYIPPALVNFLALLGWSYDDKTTIMSRDELVERFIARARRRRARPTFDYAEARLDERRLPARAPAGRVRRRAASPTCASRATTGTRSSCARPRRSCRRRSRRSASSPSSPASSSHASSPTGAARPASVLAAAARGARATSSRSTAERIEAALRGLAERLGLKPREAFQPIRIAVTGSKVSPGPLREPRAARPRGVARAPQAARRAAWAARAGRAHAGTASQARRRKIGGRLGEAIRGGSASDSHFLSDKRLAPKRVQRILALTATGVGRPATVLVVDDDAVAAPALPGQPRARRATACSRLPTRRRRRGRGRGGRRSTWSCSTSTSAPTTGSTLMRSLRARKHRAAGRAPHRQRAARRGDGRARPTASSRSRSGSSSCSTSSARSRRRR